MVMKMTDERHPLWGNLGERFGSLKHPVTTLERSQLPAASRRFVPIEPESCVRNRGRKKSGQVHSEDRHSLTDKASSTVGVSICGAS
ncbi:MAG: hypothetical protein LZF60_190021 [Nitrospira sp.]|nr:MAG: hypothetical protein LZF60_190021 [Nitrospira sp.]